MKGKLGIAGGLAAGVIMLTACSSGLTHGTVTGYSYAPPTTQTVNTSCMMWNRGHTYCYYWNTMQLPVPQDCTLNLKSGAQTGSVNIDVSEAACAGYVGKQWPLSSGTAAP